MTGERDLAVLLRSMDPELRSGSFVFTHVTPGHTVPEADVLASVQEPEGRSVVIARETAEARGLAYDYVAAWIILRVHSSLAAVGLTAAVSGALAVGGLSCNVIAGYHHDHLLVPSEEADRAMSILRGLATGDLSPVPGHVPPGSDDALG